MSYSFTVAADTKEEAKRKIAENFDNVVAGQSSHSADRDAGVACAQAFVDMLAEPVDGDEIYVSVHGSLSWRTAAPEKFYNAIIGINAGLRDKKA
jgi:hypothetical protein